MFSPVSSCARALWPEQITDSDSLVLSEDQERSVSDLGDPNEYLTASDSDVSDGDEDWSDPDSETLTWDEEIEEMRLVRRTESRRVVKTPPPLYIPCDVVSSPRGDMDPRFITPKKGPTPLQLIVITNQWQFFWSLLIMDSVTSWDTTFHPKRPHASFNELSKLLDPEHAEMKATFHLVGLMYDEGKAIDMNEIQKCLVLLDPRLDWNKEVVRPLQYKRFYLNHLGVPAEVIDRVWKDHVQRDVVHQAIRRCAAEAAAAAFGDAFAPLVANRHITY